MKRFTAVALYGAILLSSVFAQYDPPAGAEDVQQFYSPLFLAKGASVTSAETPEADTVNPAISGANQRPVLDLSYIGLTGLDAAGVNGWLGHAVNVGMSFPTPGGVITGSAHFLSSYLPTMTLGTNVGLRLSFAKDLYPNLLVGVGLNLDAGGYNTTDFGASVDLGVLGLAGRVGALKNFRWGIVMRNMGKWYTPVPGRSPMPAPFTPAVGVGFDLIDNPSVTAGVTTDLSFPSFQNVRLNLGGTLSLWGTVDLNAGWQLDMRSLLDRSLPQRSLLPSFGVSVTIKTDLKQKSGFIAEQGWNQSEVRTRMSAAPLYGNVWGFGLGVNAPLGIVDHTPPVISVDYPETRYISPNNNGIQDALEFPVSIKDSRYVMGYLLRIEDESGKVVRIIANKENRPENKGFQNVIDRLTAVKSGVPIPATLRWDGTADSGKVVPDGTYRFSVEAWDDNGNRAISKPYLVVVDDTPPVASVSVRAPDDLIFSPNGDGNKDTLAIEQTGSVEKLWTGEIVNAEGKTVLTRTWTAAAPAGFVWNGRDDSGKSVPDGVYSYRIAAVDEAGNRGAASLDNIIVDTAPTPVELSIDRSYFSPNGDGVNDTVTLTPIIPSPKEVLHWSLSIAQVDGSQRSVRTYSGEKEPPTAIVFDGHGTNAEMLPEAAYRATLTVFYRNGNEPTAASPMFTLDLTPPNASVKASDAVFSPNGDGSKDTITFFQETSKEEIWHGTISNAAGREIRSFTWHGAADLQVTWDGRADNGLLVPDGPYEYELTSVDRAGNKGMSNKVEFRVDTEATPVIISAEYDQFSPNGDGVKDTITITPTLRRNDAITRYTLSIEPSGDSAKAGSAVRSISGKDRIDGPFVWDGRDDQGQRVADGAYRGVLTVLYANGNRETARTAPFTVDTVYPDATIATDYTLFSPDGDGNRDTIRIRQTSSDETLWEGRIVSSSGKDVRTYFWKGRLSDLTWDGTDDAGNRVPDGSYSYMVSAQDQAGNRTQKSIPGIVVDTRPAAVFVTVDKAGFSPNGDGFRDSETFTMYTNLLDGVQSWRLSIFQVDAKGALGKVVREYSGDTLKASFTVTWDGLSGTSDGSVAAVAPDGQYRARFEITYRKGNHPSAETPDFSLDTTAPVVNLQLSPLPFSPDNDGVNDELHIGIGVKDASEIRDWRLEILDRNRASFTEFSGTGMPARELIWDGRSRNGELVISAEDYPYVFTITDVLGNTTVRKGVIPVDILVIRDGDRLKVRVSSITFTADSPELVIDPSTLRGLKNEEILKRLVEIFSKYSAYRIRIEGHAVNISGTPKEQEQELVPLSLARAQSVKDALAARGISAARMTVAGLGDVDPVVPDTDIENRWKNRRVEFILIK
ncbi:MAG TPA: gliding motility-associated C-terminal domain-containing protein [Spirochaetia bacterium]|nr:gliding motility-associated C-terminal domain-containing protein [Spirochaetia bacterium]